MTSVFTEIIGPSIRTSWKSDHLIVITDRFSKMTKKVQMKGISRSEEFAEHFVN